MPSTLSQILYGISLNSPSPPGYDSTLLLATAGTPADAPLFEISATILPRSTYSCTPPEPQLSPRSDTHPRTKSPSKTLPFGNHRRTPSLLTSTYISLIINPFRDTFLIEPSLFDNFALFTNHSLIPCPRQQSVKGKGGTSAYRFLS